MSGWDGSARSHCVVDSDIRRNVYSLDARASGSTSNSKGPTCGRSGIGDSGTGASGLAATRDRARNNRSESGRSRHRGDNRSRLNHRSDSQGSLDVGNCFGSSLILSNSGNNFFPTSQGVSDSKTLGDCLGKSSGVVLFWSTGNIWNDTCSDRTRSGATSSNGSWVDIGEVPIGVPHVEMALGHMSTIRSFRNCCESCKSGSEKTE